MALERSTYTGPLLLKHALAVCQATTSRRVVTVALKVEVRTLPELPSVQILVVVANNQVGALMTEVEKGST
jgi:hypothetical protein